MSTGEAAEARPGHRPSLTLRLVWVTAAIMAVILGVLGVVREERLRSVLYRETASGLEVNYHTLLSGLGPRYTLPVNLAVQASGIAQGLSSLTVGVVVVDQDGQALASAPIGETGASPPIFPTSVYDGAMTARIPPYFVVGSHGKRVIVVLEPIESPVGVSGIAELATPAAPIDQALREETWFDVLAGFLALAGVTVALYVLLRRYLAPLKDMAQVSERVASGDFQVELPEGSVEEVALLTTSFATMVRRVEGALGRERAEQERMRSFVADASHSLRTPLTVLNGRLDLLLRGEGRDQASLETSLRDLRAEGERMARIVQGLLVLARLDMAQSGQVAEVYPVLPVAATLEALRPRLESLVQDRSLTVKVPPPNVGIRAPGEALDTIVTNLVENACRHTADDGEILVKADALDGRLRITVRDTGTGIGEGDLPHLFERFYRGRRTAAMGRRDGGAGLGLAIVQRWAVALGGRAEAGNRTDRRGAIFTVELPIAGEDPGMENRSSGQPSARTNGRAP